MKERLTHHIASILGVGMLFFIFECTLQRWMDGRPAFTVLGIPFSSVRNEAMAFSIPLPSMLIVAVSFFALCILAYLLMYAYRYDKMIEVWGYNLMVWGALANFAQRTTHGYVVDYINIGWWPVFNFADVMLGIGVFLVAYVFIREWMQAHASVSARASL